MLYSGAYGKSLVSDDFNQKCLEMHVEARVQSFPNPGDPMHSMRLVTFKNFNNESVTVIEQNRKQKRHFIPAKGELQIMVAPGEEMPLVQKGFHENG